MPPRPQLHPPHRPVGLGSTDVPDQSETISESALEKQEQEVDAKIKQSEENLKRQYDVSCLVMESYIVYDEFLSLKPGLHYYFEATKPCKPSLFGRKPLFKRSAYSPRRFRIIVGIVFKLLLNTCN